MVSDDHLRVGELVSIDLFEIVSLLASLVHLLLLQDGRRVLIDVELEGILPPNIPSPVKDCITDGFGRRADPLCIAVLVEGRGVVVGGLRRDYVVRDLNVTMVL